MATTQERFQAFLQDHPGARWLAPFIALLIVMLLGLALMVIYPHLAH